MSRINRHEDLITPLLTPTSLLPRHFQQIIHRENRRSWCRKYLHGSWSRLPVQNTPTQLLKRKKMYLLAKLRMSNRKKTIDTKHHSDFSNKIDSIVDE